MKQDMLKQKVAQAAIQYVPDNAIIGVGTGSTVNFFIEELAKIKGRIEGCVSSSSASTNLLKDKGFRVYDLNSVDNVPVYFDGADEATESLFLTKGGGGALTREKIIAAVAEKFICMVDQSKIVPFLGKFPLPVEVIPMARGYVARELVKLGGQPQWRENFITDNNNYILDVHNMEIMEPVKMEHIINQITGVVTVGLFAQRPADILLISKENEVQNITR